MSNYPEYFLGNTVEEAEKIHNKFVGILNNIAKDYALHTGLDKGDLFNEALFGLSDAVVKYNPNRSGDFKNFAVFKIKDRLNHFVRLYSNTISVPKYIYQATKLLNQIDRVLEKYGDYDNSIVNFIKNKDFYDLDLDYTDLDICEQAVHKLENIAERAGISVDKLLKRLEFIPTETDGSDIDTIGQCDTEIEVSAELNNILSQLNEDERYISKALIQDKTYEEIGYEMNRSSTWVANKVKTIRKKVRIQNDRNE